MIEASEELLSLKEAARTIPCRRGGRKTSVSCLYRWTNNGCRGIRLEYAQVGATRCTSREALTRFFSALTAQAETRLKSAPSPQPTRLPAHRRNVIAAAERILTAAGI